METRGEGCHGQESGKVSLTSKTVDKTEPMECLGSWTSLLHGSTGVIQRTTDSDGSFQLRIVSQGSGRQDKWSTHWNLFGTKGGDVLPVFLWMEPLNYTSIHLLYQSSLCTGTNGHYRVQCGQQPRAHNITGKSEVYIESHLLSMVGDGGVCV